MREVTQEEVAQRLDRAEREHRSLRRVGAVVLLGIAAGALMGHMHPAGKTVEPNNSRQDAGGPLDLMASWVWKHFEEYVRKHLARHGKREPSPEELRATFEAIWRESAATLLVQEPWMGTMRFKALARLRPENAEPFLADPMGYILTHYGGGKFKVTFHHGMHFVGTRNFKPEGEPRWQALPGLTEE